MKVVTRSVFKIIYDQFVIKLKKQHEILFPTIPANDQRIFGRAKHKDESYTARYFMLENSSINEYLSQVYSKKDGVAKREIHDYINPRYLYDLKKATYDKGNESISIKEPYSTIIPLFFECKTFEEVNRKFSKDNKWISYTGFYYSRRRNLIDIYKIKILFDDLDLEGHPHHAKFKVKELGFHDYSPEPEYSGYAYIVGAKLHLVLTLQDKNHHMTLDRLKMVFDSGGNPESKDVMRGSILAVSATQGNPIISLETALVKDSYKSKKELIHEQESELLNLKRYLNLHRNTFWIRPSPLDLEEILINRSNNVDTISHLVGVYRVWRFNEDFDIIQSKLIIENDYSSVCYNNSYKYSNLKEQVCLLKINKLPKSKNETLCISTHPKKGTATISYIILQFDNEYDWNKSDSQKLIFGSISFVGEDNRNPMQGGIVMKWEAKEDTEDLVKLKKILLSEAKTNIRYKHQFDKLVDLTKMNQLPKGF